MDYRRTILGDIGIVLSLVCLLFLPRTSWADGIDIYMVLTGAPGFSGSGKTVLWIALFLLINYILNFIVIGLAAQHVGKLALRRLSKDLIIYTALGQVADRLGAILVWAMVYCLHNVSPGPLAAEVFIIPLNLACVAAPVAILTWYFTAHRWQLPRTMSYVLTIAAMVLLHPVIISFVTYGIMFPRQ